MPKRPGENLARVSQFFDVGGTPGPTGIIDIETAGVDPAKSPMLEIGAVVTDPAQNYRVTGRFKRLIRPDLAQIFKDPEMIQKLTPQELQDLSQAIVRHGTDLPVSIPAKTGVTRQTLNQIFVSNDVAEAILGAGTYPGNRMTPAKMMAGISAEQAVGELQDFLHKNRVSAVTSYNIDFDKNFLARFGGTGRPWGRDLMYMAQERLGLKHRQSAEKVARQLGILKGGRREVHRSLADAILEARIFKSLMTDESLIQETKDRLLRDTGIGYSKLARKPRMTFQQAAKADIDQIGRFIGRHPGKFGAAAGFLGLMALQPLRFFSARDDNYNTISGMDERGVSASLRKLNTDFGSGYQGPKVHGQTIGPEVTGFRQYWFPDFGEETLARLEEAKAESQIDYGQFREEEMVPIGDDIAAVPLSEFNVRWEDADTLLARRTGLINTFFGKDIAIRLTGIDAPEVQHPGDPTNWFRYHQQQPFGQESTAAAEALSRDRELYALIKPGAETYGRHIGLIAAAGADRTINEELVRMGAAAHLPYGEAGTDIYDRQQFQQAEEQAFQERRGMWSTPYFQAYREVSKGMGGRLTFTTLTDLTRLSRNYNVAAAESYLYSAQQQGQFNPATGRRIGRSLIPSYGRFFSAKDDNYNTIEALKHGGQSEFLRKALTDFGSGFNAVRQLARMLGRSSDEIMGSPAFKEALKRGTKVRTLGEGAFGTAELRRGIFEGQEFEFVVKTTKAQQRKGILGFLSKKPSPQVLEAQQRQLSNEYTMLSRIGDESQVVPSAYMFEDGHLYMEAMPGHKASSLENIPQKAVGQLTEETERLASMNIANFDIQNNILYDPTTQRLSWIDFGMARELSEEQVKRIGLRQKYQNMLKKTMMAKKQLDTAAMKDIHGKIGGQMHYIPENKKPGGIR